MNVNTVLPEAMRTADSDSLMPLMASIINSVHDEFAYDELSTVIRQDTVTNTAPTKGVFSTDHAHMNVTDVTTGAVLDRIFIFVVSDPSILPIWPPKLISL